MKISELTSKQLISISCPTCGVAAGKKCVLYSGALRSGPHVDRKLLAAEAVEQEIRRDSALTLFACPAAG
jgi:predicted RNA-binding Zn-ribbon protein involved in translation (DUF1610 family)